MKSSSSSTPAYIRQYIYAGVFALIGFALSLLGGVWFVSSAGNAGALISGTAPMWVSAVVVLTMALTFASLWLAYKAFEKAGKETWSFITFIGGVFLILAVGQLWHLAM